MKEARVMESCSQYNLPVELLLEILSRLPAKSLVRFRCVSKSWRSLIADRSFCRLHLNNFDNNLRETHLLFFEGQVFKPKTLCVARSDTFEIAERLDTLRFTDKWCMLCSVDGLFLLQDLTLLPNPPFGWEPNFRRVWIFPSKLMLWNPSIRASRVLPPSPQLPKEMTEIKYIDLGFGFSPLIQDYKHVRLIQHGESDLHSISIYTVGTNSWKTIEFKGKGSCSSWHWQFYFNFEWKTVCFKGALCFLPMHSYVKEELVLFDLAREEFASTRLPIEDSLDYLDIDCQALNLFDGGCSLGVLNVLPYKGSIWMLETPDADSMCWTKRYEFGLTVPDLPDEVMFSIPYQWTQLELLHVKKNNTMLLQWLFKEVTLLNLESREERFILENSVGTEPEPSDLHRVCDYVESLVLMNG